MPHSFVALLALLTSAALPTRVDEIPVIERPPDHFYGAIAGRGSVKARWQVTPASVPFGQSFTLTLVVENAVNPDELARPPLLELDAFRDLFSSVEDLPPAPVASGEVRFDYRVTPRNEGNYNVPELKYRYYQPQAPQAHRTFTTHAAKVPFAVTRAVVPPSPPLLGPPEFFAMRPHGGFRSGAPDWWAWVALIAGGPVVGVAWVFVWRRMYPNMARLAAIRRSRAVRIALDRLRRPQVTADAVAITLRNYLIARYGLPFTAQTPAEVVEGLEGAHMPADRVSEVEAVLRACDAARFAATTDAAVSAPVVAKMIERWEATR